MNNRLFALFTLPAAFSAFILTAGTLWAQPSDDTLSITIPPGGYSWSVFTDSTGFSDFETVSVLAPGPITGLNAMLPDSSAGVLEICSEWLREDLTIRFTDLKNMSKIYKSGIMTKIIYCQQHTIFL